MNPLRAPKATPPEKKNGEQPPRNRTEKKRTDHGEKNTKTERPDKPTTTNGKGQIRRIRPKLRQCSNGRRTSLQREDAEDKASSSHHHQQVLHFERRFGFSGGAWSVLVRRQRKEKLERERFFDLSFFLSYRMY
jgi:hypothetical protein